MTSPPRLTDRTALIRNKSRIKPSALFLHDITVNDIQERLALTNRDFKAMAIVSDLPEYWPNKLTSDTQVEPKTISAADLLDFQGHAFDLIIHPLSLHWANDPVGQLIQCNRALKPDGLFIASLFAGQTLFELRSALAHAESELTGGLSPRVAPMSDIRDLGAALQRAEFALPVADRFSTTVEYTSLMHLLHDLRHMGEENAQHSRQRHFTHPRLFQRAEEIYREHYATPQGTLPATFEIITLTGWAPDASQPQPLRPGSAKTRLADALQVSEHSFPTK